MDECVCALTPRPSHQCAWTRRTQSPKGTLEGDSSLFAGEGVTTPTPSSQSSSDFGGRCTVVPETSVDPG